MCSENIQKSDMETSQASLLELYTKGLKAMQAAELLPRNDTRQNLYITSRRYLEQAMNLVESLSLFSDNETIDDVATNDLRYGLGDERIERSMKSDETFPTTATDSDLESAIRIRNMKIEQYRKMKLLEDRLVELDSQIKRGQEVDDEAVREYYMGLIKKWTEESLESLEREVKPALFFERSAESKGSGSSTSRPKIAITPSTITIVKNQLQKQVFGLGYPSRPTVTVDEFISKKIKDGDLAFQAHKEIYANSLQRYAEKPNLLREQEELSDVEHEEKEERDDNDELMKKRHWDEFKDENPRGSGNRHNMG